MKINMQLYLFLIAILFFACDGNYRNVKVSGQVFDSTTSIPIENAEINITYWVYDTSIWESKKVNKTVFTNQNGYFETSFDKGEALDISVSAINYKTENKSKTLKRNYAEFTFYLDQEDSRRL